MTTRRQGPQSRGHVIGLGYEGADLTSFLADVVARGLDVVIDVRLTPLSRKRGFSKRALAEALSGIGVTYRHEPALGNPKANRAGFAGPTEEWSAARARYDELLSTPAAQDALTRIAQNALTARTAVLCFEADQQHCHRDVVLTHLSNLTAGRWPLQQSDACRARTSEHHDVPLTQGGDPQ